MKTLLIFLLGLLMTACYDKEPVIDDSQSNVVKGKYVPANIAARLDRMVYIDSNQMGFEFYRYRRALYYNLYHFGLSHELPLRAKTRVPVTYETQKSQGTWVFKLENRLYLLNETDMRLIADTGETLYPQRVLLPKLDYEKIKIQAEPAPKAIVAKKKLEKDPPLLPNGSKTPEPETKPKGKVEQVENKRISP